MILMLMSILALSPFGRLSQVSLEDQVETLNGAGQQPATTVAGEDTMAM